MHLESRIQHRFTRYDSFNNQLFDFGEKLIIINAVLFQDLP